MTVVACFADLAVIIGIPIAGYQLFLSRRIARANLERIEKQATIEFTNEIISKADELNKEINKVFDDVEIIKHSDPRYQDNERVRRVVIDYLKLMERLSVGLNAGVYNLDIFSRICRKKTLDSYARLVDVIDGIRESSNNPNAFVEFEYVCEKLRKKTDIRDCHTGDIENRV